MAYQKTNWQDHVVEYPNRYVQTAGADGTIVLTKSEGNVVQPGTAISATNLNKLEQGVFDANAQVEQASRQTQTLSHGVSVLNGGVDAPVNLQIEGRTLIPMQNNILEASKLYVLADKRTKLKWADASVTTGVAKFTGKAEKPALVAVANYEGKVTGSTLENPHKSMYALETTLQPPTGVFAEIAQGSYDEISTLGTRNFVHSINENGRIAQHSFSKNIIQEIERRFGRIPRTTLAEKVQWVKDNVKEIRANWHGFGSAVGGNKATFVVFNVANNLWHTYRPTHNNNASAVIVYAIQESFDAFIDADGFVHFLAYAEASDGVTASTINTDYFELEIELKPDAVLHDPRVPLYEVTQAEYDAAFVTIDAAEVARRYPSVEGVTHIQNPYVMAEGENLVPPFSEWSVVHVNAKVVSAYELELNAAGAYNTSTVVLPVIKGQTYNANVLKIGATSETYIYKGKTTSVVVNLFNGTFTVDDSYGGFITLAVTNGGVGKFTFKEPMLTLGTVAKPFVPRNPSYALFETKLAKIGDAADLLFEQDGKMVKRKVIEDVVLDGSLAWNFQSDHTNYKRFILNNVLDKSIMANSQKNILLKFDGTLIRNSYNVANGLLVGDGTPSNPIYLTILDSDTGFGEDYTPTANEIKAYFNGWKVKTADVVSFKPTAWVSVVDGSDAPTQTEEYVSTTKAPNYTPYKMSYVLATPKIEEIRAEGVISVNGLTQIEVGSGVVVREKVVPFIDGFDVYNINNDNLPSSLLKNKTKRLFNIYKNGVIDKNWTTTTHVLSSGYYSQIKSFNFDETAEYTVSYVVLDKQTFTSNVVNLIVQYANNVRTALDDAVKALEDTKTQTTVNSLLIYDMLKRLKAGGL